MKSKKFSSQIKKISFIALLIISFSFISADYIKLNGGEVSVNDSSSLDGFSSATWNMWINQASYVNNAGIAGKYRAVTGGRSYLLKTANSGDSISVILSKDGANIGTYSSLISKKCGITANGDWTMITLTYDGKKITYYKDGVKCDEDTTSISSIYNSNSPLRLGGGNSIYFKGGIDEYAFYRDDLSSLQIERIYNESQYGKDLGKSVPVLVYHIIDDGSTSITTSPANFDKQMKLLKDNGFKTITMNNFNEWKKGNFNLPDKPVIIVFDDGFKTTYTKAKPILDKYGFKGTVGVVTRYASFTSDTSGYMKWEELNNLKTAGWDLQSHSVTHSHMLQLSESQFRKELQLSRDTIQNKTGKKPTSFIFPFHESNPTYTKICGEYYDLCWTQGSYYPSYNYLSTDGKKYLSLRRINVNNSVNINEFTSNFGKDMNFAGKWDMEEGYGTTTKDSSGRRNTGYLLSGASWVSGIGTLSVESYEISSTREIDSGIIELESNIGNKKDKKPTEQMPEEITNIIETDKGKSSMKKDIKEKRKPNFPDNMDIEGEYYNARPDLTDPKYIDEFYKDKVKDKDKESNYPDNMDIEGEYYSNYPDLVDPDYIDD